MSTTHDDARSPAARARLRLWLRMLRLTRAVEGELRERLRREFNATLPRFDVMAALYRFPDGMLLSELSRYLMVSNGNVTGIVSRLVDDGLVTKAQRGGDRRTSMVRLTVTGVRDFERMAARHAGWVDDVLDGVTGAAAERLAGELRDATERALECCGAGGAGPTTRR